MGQHPDMLSDTEFELRRSVHRVIRAMHDGECPSCHAIVPAETMQLPNGNETCPVCGFTITKQDREEGIALFGPIMKRNVELFEQWRASRK